MCASGESRYSEIWQPRLHTFRQVCCFQPKKVLEQQLCCFQLCLTQEDTDPDQVTGTLICSVRTITFHCGKGVGDTELGRDLLCSSL